MGQLILQELAGRLGKNTTKRGKDIFFPRFIQSVLNFLDNSLAKLPSVDKSKIGYPKSMTKLIFGNLDSRNDVDVRLEITPHMLGLFRSYPHNLPTFDPKSVLARSKLEEPIADQGPSSTNPQPNTSTNSEPPASSSQQGVLVK